MSANNSSLAYCPECDTRIRFGKRPPIGETTSCPECRTSLMVVESSPVELDYADSYEYDAQNYEDSFDDLSEWEEQLQR